MAKGKIFRRFGVATVIAVYLLILVGGIVRSTGAGMGCPDWPKCFGQWIPPTHISQLPSDYKEVYAQQRAEKNARFAKYLEAFGMDQKAQRLQDDPNILEEADFNPYKTWIEYINRLIGALIGLFILITTVNSFAYVRHDFVIVLMSAGSLILVLFQAWIGSIVVSTNLIPWMVTVHMLIALVIVSMLIYAVARAHGKDQTLRFLQVKSLSKYNLPLMLCFTLSIIQIIAGTQVRESVDAVSVSLEGQLRERWIDNLGAVFHFHRSFAIAIILANGWLFWRVYQSHNHMLFFWGRLLTVMIGLEILTGIVMAYFAIPPFAQPLHLLFGNTIFGAQFVIFLIVNSRWIFGKRYVNQHPPLALST